MKVDRVQGASPLVEPLTHTNFMRSYKGVYAAAGKGYPLQSSFCSVYHYPPPWCGGVFLSWGKGLIQGGEVEKWLMAASLWLTVAG